MATWIAHLRLAENLLSHGFKLDIAQFAIGNIAPDSGLPDDNGNFQPPSHVTHFGVEGKKCDPLAFYQQHLQDKTHDTSHYAFLMGYYAHLIADIAWSDIIYLPKKETPLWKAGLEDNPEFIWEIKKDWYGYDFIYLNAHPEQLFYTHFMQVDSVPDYLDILPTGNFTKSVKRIQDYYSDEENMRLSLAHDYPYLSQAEMDNYIQQTTQRLISAFETMNVPLA